MPKIAEVQLRAIRGVRPELRVVMDGQSLVVKGDNGTGKSSIVRGLQWALRDEGAPSGATGEESFRRHVLEPPSAPRVIVTFADGATLEVTTTGVTAGDAALEYRESCTRANPFLVRSQLLNFLTDRPSDRFRYLESFLDLTQADEIRDTVSKEADATKATAEREATARAQMVDRVWSALPTRARPVNKTWPSAYGATVDLGVEMGLVVAEPPASWDQLLEAAGRARKFAEGDDLPLRRARIVSAQRAIAEVNRGEGLPDVRKTVAERDVRARDAGDAGALPVIEDALTYVEAASPDNCPVCQQGIDHRHLVLDLRTRLGALSAFRELGSRLERELETWRGRWETFLSAITKSAEALGVPSFREYPGSPAPPEVAEPLARARTDAAFRPLLLSADTPALEAWMKALVSFVSAKLDSTLKALPPEGSTVDLTAFANAVTEAHRCKDKVTAADDGEQKARRRSAVLADLAAAIRRARQDTAKTLLEEISTSVADYYHAIHPRGDDGDVTDAPAIDIQRMGGGTAYVRGQFNGQRIEDPRWVYSDGHLDTVGICVFLAMRRFRARRPTDCRLMVLDDIVLSIDLVHAPRLLDLLRDKFSDHQILIFTHNGIFFDLCVSHLPAFRRRIISSWSLQDGPRLGDHSTAMDRLAQSIESSTSPKEIAMDMMALLDEWLGEARFVLALSVQAKRGEQYTLTEIWLPFVKALDDVEKKLKTPIGKAKTLVGNMKDVTRVRNGLGAHENQFAREYPLGLVRGLAKTSLDLVRTLYCTGCGQFAMPIPNREAPFSLHCRCEKLRYTRPAPS